MTGESLTMTSFLILMATAGAGLCLVTYIILEIALVREIERRFPERRTPEQVQAHYRKIVGCRGNDGTKYH